MQLIYIYNMNAHNAHREREWGKGPHFIASWRGQVCSGFTASFLIVLWSITLDHPRSKELVSVNIGRGTHRVFLEMWRFVGWKDVKENAPIDKCCLIPITQEYSAVLSRCILWSFGGLDVECGWSNTTNPVRNPSQKREILITPGFPVWIPVRRYPP